VPIHARRNEPGTSAATALLEVTPISGFECPSKPLLVSENLDRLRSSAVNYCFTLMVDDTIGVFCNVDALGAADVIITSLTKSFNG